MENSSTMSKRRSLTLSSRLLHKRHSASPQSRVRASAAQQQQQDVADRSLSPASLSISDNVESTPPNKKTHSLDDSLDFSPHNHLSPSCLFSQTLVTGSPEVSWRWNCDGNGRGDRVNTTSDSGFDSEEFGPGAMKQKDRRYKQGRVDAANENRRKQQENKQWRAQQLRDQEVLKERCDKLHRQLDKHIAALELPDLPGPEPIPVEDEGEVETAANAALADFLNDSDTDCFLLEASQQLESNVAPRPVLMEKPVATTPTTHQKYQKEKRSSFYMKFLEDESESEDWLSALDEAMVAATQPKKPRTSLQRYKSMPSNTASDAATNNSCATSSSACHVAVNGSGHNNDRGKGKGNGNGTGKLDTPGIKRHASSHALSPAISSARGNLFGRRK